MPPIYSDDELSESSADELGDTKGVFERAALSSTIADDRNKTLRPLQDEDVSTSSDELLPRQEGDEEDEDASSEGTIMDDHTAVGRDGSSLRDSSGNTAGLAVRSSTVSRTGSTSSGTQRCELTVELPVSTMVNPRSSASNYRPPLPVNAERDAVSELVPLAKPVRGNADDSEGGAGESYVYLELDDFEIYVEAADLRSRLRPLQHLAAGKSKHDVMYFDGVLRVGTTRLYVQRVPFSEAPVDRYGTMYATVRGHVSIRSRLNERRPIYYRLGRPSATYARFYAPYLWVADLGKHFVDYCEDMTDPPRQQDVCIAHFKAHFAKWLHRTHPRSAVVKAWHGQYGRDDFRSAVVAHGDYLWKEASVLLGFRKASNLGFFKEILFRMYKTHEAKIPAGCPCNKKGEPLVPLPTVVTPYMYSLFCHMAIGPFLQKMPGKRAPERIDASVILPQRRTPFWTGPPPTPQSSFTSSPPLLATASATLRPSNGKRKIQPGDLISTMPDDSATGSKWWAEKEQDAYWYALVHKVSEPKGRQFGSSRVLDVVWLYRPEHTPCRQTRYPWSNELFLSDHCTCDESGCNVLESEVVAVHSVEWFGGPDTKADFFVRQTYLASECSYVQLRPEHVFCDRSRAEEKQSAFAGGMGLRNNSNSNGKGNDNNSAHTLGSSRDFMVGDTVLAILAKDDHNSEPFEIDAFVTKAKADPKRAPTKMVRLRRLLRRQRVDKAAATAAPNEVVYTQQFVTLPVSRIVGHCLVRAFRSGAKIPTPYDRGGTGNVFFMTHKQTTETVSGDVTGLDSGGNDNNSDVVRSTDGDYQYVPLAATDRLSLRQGFDPAAPCPRLRAMELFCGCGNLGRGLEESGAIQTRYANDIWSAAMHTFMANVSSADAVEPFVGSADVYLEHAIQGTYSHAVPAPGEVDFISGGSPCQGFSTLTTDKANPKQFKNRSMVASFASFVDLYRPKYGMLENVLEFITKDFKANHKPSYVRKTGHSSDGTREDIFGQLVSSLLGLGYQLRIVLGNAWSHGAPQQRQRVFLVFAAPGFRLPEPPLPSHGSPPGVRARKMIGSLSNGKWIASPSDEPTAFPFVSAGAATADLQTPAGTIDDGLVDICVRYPDHRVTLTMADSVRHKIAAIPTQPYGTGLARARKGLTGAVRALFTETELAKESLRAYKRADPRRPFYTVRTTCAVADGRSSGDLHWREPRPLSVLEVRRAQGMPDHEVLLFATARDQWKMVGNAVSRHMALALGLSLRQAWLGTLYDDLGDVGSDSVRWSSGMLGKATRNNVGPHSPVVLTTKTTTTTTRLTTTETTTKTITTTTTTASDSLRRTSSSPTATTGVSSSSPPPSFLPPSSSRAPSTSLPFKQNSAFQTNMQQTATTATSAVETFTAVTPSAPVSSVLAATTVHQEDADDQLATVPKRKRSESVDMVGKWPRRDSEDGGFQPRRQATEVIVID
ncbi:DNA methyltransferase dim-2 [Niveomyces insectorum RCEF 264]|uniref:DNA (cytosine-5-)-methyltransferase n=1 Tax=Niveomyces insectorum RCEF 264 TaxID=1081102 RepID=A0A167X9V9_9HYPO|nr:DNA methyltransferase dim-2 [Niveomyces insectorum RCEF 264]